MQNPNSLLRITGQIMQLAVIIIILASCNPGNSDKDAECATRIEQLNDSLKQLKGRGNVALNSGLVAEIKNNFQQYYRHNSTNSTVLFPPLKIKWSDFKVYFGHQYLNAVDTCIAIYYGIDDANNLIYLIAKVGVSSNASSLPPNYGVRNADGTNDPDKYIKLHPMTGASKINFAEFTRLTTRYYGGMAGGTSYPGFSINRFPNFTDAAMTIQGRGLNDIHPKCCMHTGRELGYFYLDNITSPYSSAINDSGLIIIFDHGAIFKGDLSEPHPLNDYKVQTPILIWEKDGNVLLGSETSHDRKYNKQALDIGNLCPPDCKKID